VRLAAHEEARASRVLAEICDSARSLLCSHGEADISRSTEDVMNHLIPKRRWAALLILGIAVSSIASAAFAGGYRSHAGPRVSASFAFRTGDVRPIGFGGIVVRDRGGSSGRDRGWYSARRVRDEACAVDHPAHAWFDGRLWCSGKNADGSWRGPWHCEDDYGRKKVNLASFDPNCEKWVR
jgi:hypothetical protein